MIKNCELESEEIDFTKEILEKIKENAKLVLKNNYKYYSFIHLGGQKIKLLSEGDSRKKVEEESVKEFKYICCNDIEKMLRFDKEIIIFLFHIRKPTKEEIKKADDRKQRYKKDGTIPLFEIKGKLIITVDSHSIIVDKKNKDNPVTLKNLSEKGYSLGDRYWLNNRYLKKYDEVPILHLKKILGVLKIGSPLATRKMSDVIKKKQPKFLTI